MNQESEPAILELYKTAFARLNFQDEYLFKFSTVFLTAHGALAAAAGSDVFQAESARTIISLSGLFLALVWAVWIHHNDYWHSVWDGVLRRIERHLETEARVFDLDHHAIATEGKRRKPQWLKGHLIAQMVPCVLAVGWICSLLNAFSK